METASESYDEMKLLRVYIMFQIMVIENWKNVVFTSIKILIFLI